MRLILATLALLAMTAGALSPAAAQEKPRTILVLDGSGSMWGQIDGVPKIDIARKVVAELLQSLPEDQELGLTVYGHRRKGDCHDIETVVPPGPQTRAAILRAIRAIRPKGKTPMTDAVIAAAEALRYTEEAATVILVSDGIETCNPDPCAAARALEETGVNFTAHVIGFDVTEAKALAQMRCIAEATGGRFLTAANATELATAMTEVATAPPPPPKPKPVEVTFDAIDGRHGPRIETPLIWTLRRGEEVIEENLRAPAFTATLPPGEYRVEVLRPEDEATAEEVFGVGSVAKTVTLALPEFRPPATIEAPDSGPAGATVKLRWTGPGGEIDYISVDRPGGQGDITYAYVKEGSPLDIRLPPEPGQYEFRYKMAVAGGGRKVIATRPVTVTPVSASIEPLGPLVAGGKVKLRWSGPDYENDYIDVVRPGESSSLTYAYTSAGSPLELPLPAEPGRYELRYVMHLHDTPLLRLPVEIKAASASLSAPESAEAGSTIEVGWEGPGNERDYIALFPAGSDSYVSWVYASDNPARLTMPAEPGAYEIAYVLAQGDTPIARLPIRVERPDALLEAPPEAPAASALEVRWEGPGTPYDRIGVRRAGEEDRFLFTVFTSKGNPARVILPPEPGVYELVYLFEQDDKELASRMISLSAPRVGLKAPRSAAPGSRIKVKWAGPGDEFDAIILYPAGRPDQRIVSVFTRLGNPADIFLPNVPGDYEIGYWLSAYETVLAATPISVR